MKTKMSEGSEVFFVDRILATKMKGGVMKFKVRWEGYGPEGDTWEPYENVQNCQEALDDFQARQIRKKKSPSKVARRLLPKDFVEFVEDADSSDEDNAENSRSSSSRFLPSSSEDDQTTPSTSTSVKKPNKFRHTSKCIISSESDDEQSEVVAEREKISSVKKKAGNTTETRQKCDTVKLAPTKTSNVEKHCTVTKSTTKNYDPRTICKKIGNTKGHPQPNSSQKPEKLKSTKLDTIVPQPINTQKGYKKDDINLKCVKKTEKSMNAEFGSRAMNCAPEKGMRKGDVKPKCTEKSKSAELDSSAKDCVTEAVGQRIKNAEKRDKKGDTKPKSVIKPQQCRTAELGSSKMNQVIPETVQPRTKNMDKGFIKCDPMPKSVKKIEKSMTVEHSSDGMDCDPQTVYSGTKGTEMGTRNDDQKSKSVRKPEKSTSVKPSSCTIDRVTKKADHRTKGAEKESGRGDPKLKSSQRQEKSKTTEQSSSFMAPIPDAVHPRNKNTEKEIGKGDPKPKSVQESKYLKSTELNFNAMNFVSETHKPRPKSVQITENASSLRSIPSTSAKDKPSISGAAVGSTSPPPTEFLKSFQIPRLPPSSQDRVVPEPASMPENKSTSVSTSNLQKIPQKHSSSKISMKRRASATEASSSAADARICKQPRLPDKPTPFKIGAKRRVSETITSESVKEPDNLSTNFGEHWVSRLTRESNIGIPPKPNIPCLDSSAVLTEDRVCDSGSTSPLSARNPDDEFPTARHDALLSLSPGLSPNSQYPFNWSPQALSGQGGLPFLNEATNFSESSACSLFSTKTNEGRESSGGENSRSLPEQKTDTKENIKTKGKSEMSTAVIESLHLMARKGIWQEFEKWYSVPGRNDWELKGARGSTILMQAAVSGVTEMVDMLLVNGANVNAQHSKNNKKTPLMLASENGRDQIVKSLIAYGAKLNMVDSMGKTALMLACRNGFDEVVRVLLNFGADFYIKSKASPSLDVKRRITALQMAKDAKSRTKIEEEPDKHKRYSNIVKMLSDLESRVTAAFEGQIKLMTSHTSEILEPLFHTHIFNLNEDTRFTLSFNYKEQPFEPDTGMLLFVAHALIDVKGKVVCRMYGTVSAVEKIQLNGVRQIGITQGGDHILSFSPVTEGRNDLVLHTYEMKNSDIKLIVRAHRVKLIT